MKSENKNIENLNENLFNVEEKEEKVVIEENLTEKVNLDRETFVGSNGETYWSYYLLGKVGSRDVRIDFIPMDVGGYLALDIAFEEAKNEAGVVELVVKTEINGFGQTKTRKNVFFARFVSKDGIPYECQIKPSRSSNLSLLKTLLWKRGIKLV